MPPADAPGFCKEICRFQRPKSGAVNAKTKSILAFTIFINSSFADNPTCKHEQIVNIYEFCDVCVQRSIHKTIFYTPPNTKYSKKRGSYPNI